MPIQFGLNFQNHIPACLKYQDHKIRDVVDEMVQPILRDYQQDSLTLTARTADRTGETEDIENSFLQSIEPADAVPDSEEDADSPDNTRIDIHIFRRIREDVKQKQYTDVKTFPYDLEFAIQQNGQDKHVIKFIPPAIIPNQTDYFFSKNMLPYDGRPNLQDKLRTQLNQAAWNDILEQQALLNWPDTIPANNPELFLPEFELSQWLEPEFQELPFFEQPDPNSQWVVSGDLLHNRQLPEFFEQPDTPHFP